MTMYFLKNSSTFYILLKSVLVYVVQYAQILFSDRSPFSSEKVAVSIVSIFERINQMLKCSYAP